MIRPLDHRVLIERKRATEKYGSIVIPPRYARAPQEGIVRSVGKNVTAVKAGDVVLFGRYSGVELDEPGLVMLWERDLMGVVE